MHPHERARQLAKTPGLKLEWKSFHKTIPGSAPLISRVLIASRGQEVLALLTGTAALELDEAAHRCPKTEAAQ